MSTIYAQTTEANTSPFLPSNQQFLPFPSYKSLAINYLKETCEFVLLVP